MGRRGSPTPVSRCRLPVHTPSPLTDVHHARLLDSLPVIVYRAQPVAPYETIYVNAAIECLGYTHEEWLERSDMWVSRIHPDDRDRVQREALDAYTCGTAMDTEYRMLARDGSTRWFHDRGDMLIDESTGRPTWQGIMLDITGQRRAEQALRESEARHRTLVETAREGIWSVNEVGVTTHVNGRLCELLGRTADEIVGRPLFDLMAPESARKARALFAGRQAGARGIAEVRDLTLVHRDGREVLVRMSTSPTCNDAGEFVGALAMVTDVTERQYMEQALRESEARYRHVVANAPGMVYQFVYRPDGSKGYTFVSEGARAIFGIDPDVMLGDSNIPLDLMQPGDRAQFLARARAISATGGDFHWEGRVCLPSGQERYIQIVARDQRQADGTVISDGLVLDETQQREAIRQLEQSEIRFRLAARATNDVVYDWNIPAGVHFWGETLLTAFGYDPSQLEPTYEWWLSLVHPDDTERVTTSLNAALNGTSDSWMEEYRFRRSDGTDARVLDRGYVLRDDAGKALRLVGSMIDLTEHQLLEEQLRQSQKMEAIGRLAGGVAHDFNNIITVIKGNTGLLLESMAITDSRRDDVRQIADAADRAGGLTRQLLAFSRKQILKPRVLSVNDVVKNLEPMLGRLIGEDVAVETRLADGIGSIMADAGQLEQVLINLAVNARDAMPEGGRMLLETAEVTLDGRYAAMHVGQERTVVLPGEYVMLSMSDTGSGMSREVQARIFEPFFTTKEPGKGTGLGLSTVYGIVKQSGGHVWVYSEVGEGTVFKLYFPKVENAAAAPAGQMAQAPVAGGSETILLVEDEDSVRRLARRILHHRGYRVLESRNGKEALEVATHHPGPIHLVLTDVIMPEMSGRGLVERLRAVRPTSAVVYMSGYTADDVVRRGLFEPGSRFVQKPFIPDELLGVIREILDEGSGGRRSGPTSE